MILYDVNMKGRRMCVENGLAKLLVRRYLNTLTLKASREKVFAHSPLTKNWTIVIKLETDISLTHGLLQVCDYLEFVVVA